MNGGCSLHADPGTPTDLIISEFVNRNRSEAVFCRLVSGFGWNRIQWGTCGETGKVIEMDETGLVARMNTLLRQGYYPVVYLNLPRPSRQLDSGKEITEAFNEGILKALGKLDEDLPGNFYTILENWKEERKYHTWLQGIEPYGFSNPQTNRWIGILKEGTAYAMNDLYQSPHGVAEAPEGATLERETALTAATLWTGLAPNALTSVNEGIADALKAAEKLKALDAREDSRP